MESWSIFFGIGATNHTPYKIQCIQYAGFFSLYFCLLHDKDFHLVYKYLPESLSDDGKRPVIVVDDARDGCLGGVAEMGGWRADPSQ